MIEVRGYRQPFAVLCVATLVCGCSHNERVVTAEIDDVSTAAPFPSAAGAFAPAQTVVLDDGELDGRALAEIDECGACHPDVFAQQQASAHALTSFNNPIYRFGIDRFREAVSNKASQMCGGCHDIALLIDNAMLEDVRPDDPRAHAGITCRVCHGIKEATVDGNGSLTLSRAVIPLPKQGDAESLARHKLAVRPIESRELCGSCHRSFLTKDTGNDHFLVGQDDLGSYLTSPYGATGLGRLDEPFERETCVSCHMRPEKAESDVAADANGQVSSHRFLGGHTWLANMIGDREQLERQQQFLAKAVTLDVPAASINGAWSRPADALTDLPPGGKVAFDVVLRNVAVGHNFPGGVRDAVDTWIEVSVATSDGKIIAASGDDASAHRLRVLVGNRDAEPQMLRNTQDFWEPIIDNTIGPRDARVVRYALTLPRTLRADQLPLRIEVSLIHRSRNRELQAAVCLEAKTARGQAFAAARAEAKGVALDPCKPQPKTLIDSYTVWIGEGAAGRATDSRPLAIRLWQHGLGLLHRLPDHAAEARDSLELALTVAGDDEKMRARILLAEASVFAAGPCGPSAPEWPSCGGRIDAVRALLARSPLLADHPAAQRVMADSLRRFWQPREAVSYLQAAANAASDNPAIWRELALLLAGIGEHGRSLEAARRALELMPRDDDLLRAQALSLEALGAPSGQVKKAWSAYHATARGERPVEMKARCAERIAECAQERLEVHVHQLKPPTAAQK